MFPVHIPWRELKYAAWVPLYLAIFALLERFPSRTYWATQLPLDAAIPFCSWFVLFYCAWYPLLVGVGVRLLLRDNAAYRRYLAFLCLTFFASVFIWLVFPNGQDLRPADLPQTGLFNAMVSALYRIDTNTNVFPSVHVVGSIGAALAVHDSSTSPAALRWGVNVLAVLICASTLFIKQHAILDVVGAAALSLAAAGLIYRKRRP